MNCELSEEQKMIQQSVERFVQENYDLPKRVEISSKDPGYSKDYWDSWQSLAGLDFLLMRKMAALEATKLIPWS